MKKITTILFLTTILFSCDNKYPDYIEKEESVYMKLLSFEEGERKVNKKGFAAVSIQVLNEEKLIYKRYKEDILNLENNEFGFLLKYLTVGDSCSFMVSQKKIQEIFNSIKLTETSSQFVEVAIKFHKYYDVRQYDKEMTEQLVLKKYLEETNAKPYQGIYKEQIIKGKGNRIKNGDVITIAYEGFFMNRLIFDKIHGATAFTFTVGTQGQVIKGLEMAIYSMIEGEESKIIIPSQLAFGEGGSTAGVVPPFTTVIYKLEIVNVKQAMPKINRK